MIHVSTEVVALHHVSFEDLGTFEDELSRRGMAVRYVDACVDALAEIDIEQPELFCVLGGPIGAHEEAVYPRVLQEVDLIRRRIDARQPILGICLGGQLMARALGATVYLGTAREIGWKALSLTEAGRDSFMGALGDEAMMLHWHGDTFDVPPGCIHLAATREVPNQAFSVENFGLALQFHPEVRARCFERWLVGHACELAVNRVDVARLRRDTQTHGLELERRARVMFASWLDEIGL